MKIKAITRPTMVDSLLSGEIRLFKSSIVFSNNRLF